MDEAQKDTSSMEDDQLEENDVVAAAPDPVTLPQAEKSSESENERIVTPESTVICESTADSEEVLAGYINSFGIEWRMLNHLDHLLRFSHREKRNDFRLMPMYRGVVTKIISDFVDAEAVHLAEIMAITEVPKGALNSQLDEIIEVSLNGFFTSDVVYGCHGLERLAALNYLATSLSLKERVRMLAEAFEHAGRASPQEVVDNLAILPFYLGESFSRTTYQMMITWKNRAVRKAVDEDPRMLLPNPNLDEKEVSQLLRLTYWRGASNSCAKRTAEGSVGANADRKRTRGGPRRTHRRS